MTKLNLPTRPYRRIATEEAFSPPEMLEIYRKILAKDQVDVGFKNLMGFYMSSPSERAQHIMRCLQDLDQVRLQHMDEAGIDRQVIALTAPGVQVMDKATAVAISRSANDQLAEAVRRHPTRFTGMIAVAPQDPTAAAKEIERGVTQGQAVEFIVRQDRGGDIARHCPVIDVSRQAAARALVARNSSCCRLPRQPARR